MAAWASAKDLERDSGRGRAKVTERRDLRDSSVRVNRGNFMAKWRTDNGLLIV